MANKIYIATQFGQIPNNLLNNHKISLKAKGLFGFLQSKPNGWDFSVERLEKLLKEGKDSIRGAIKELEEWGYLERKPQKDETGKWIGYDYILKIYGRENPSENTVVGKTHQRQNPLTGSLDTISNKDISKKDISKKEDNNTSSFQEEGEIGNYPPLPFQKTENFSSSNGIQKTNSSLKSKDKTTSSYGNHEINAIYDFFKEQLGGSLDGSRQQNRYFAWLLLNRIKKDYVDEDPVAVIKLLIEAALQDEFHEKNATSFKYLYYNAQKIIQTIKGRLKNLKYFKL